MKRSPRLWATLGMAAGLALARNALAADAAPAAAPALFWVGVAQAQLAALQGELDKLGAAHIEGGALYVGATKISGNNAELDTIARRIGAVWIYQRAGDGFAAVATNMHGARGDYDLDRPIDAAASAALRKGEPITVRSISRKIWTTAYSSNDRCGEQ